MMRASADPFDPHDLAHRLEGLALGRPFYYFETIDSTNTFLRTLPPDPFQSGALALVNHQSAGRGRFDRRWGDRPGQSLLFSLLLEAVRPPSFWPLLTLGAAISACRVLEGREKAGPRIRWPNDVLLGERKVCGILTEKGSGPAALVIGLGFNVHQRLEDFPPELHQSAGSLALAAPGRPWNRADLLVAFLTDFEGVYRQWQKEQDRTILDDCRRRMSTLGRPVCFRSHDRRIEGMVMDLDRDGSLVLREPTGIVSRWSSGEVEEIKWSAEF